ncbi:N-terminal phage integrase SAM-like domain-containing protein [uncultured Faecalibacterium sp.]|uniref:N-terminal phage integrase SAM-like domain-containing protein n=1 Tax=uncultured Faecalibacterium sp. TaxID=259315 RepID=UPI002805CC78|nr:N-terminal phage integrase SAM-like domain-containing protein [uncultured Faecalibacterium sp.]
MAYITKRGSSYSVRYTYQDEHGKSCDKWESFPTKEEAVKRQKQIEHELATGNFLIPSTVTVAEFLMDWLPKQCSKHKWAPKTYQSNLALIQNLIIPYIGEMQMQKLRPYHIEALYDTLSKTPCGQYVGGKRRDLSPKQQKRTLSGTTLHEVHQLLHNSFLLAVEWGILIKSPVPVEAPQKDYPRAQHLGGGRDAGSTGQHGGPHPASGGAPDAGGRTAGRGGSRSDPGGRRL